MLVKTKVTTKLFVTNRTQAIRLPKELAFPPEVTEVDIIKQGRGVLIVPKGKGWDDFFDNGPFASEDFMVTRDQPLAAEEREEF